MNTCKNCYTEFEEQSGPIQVCPMCGEEIQIRPTTEDISHDLSADSVDVEAEEILDIEDRPEPEETVQHISDSQEEVAAEEPRIVASSPVAETIETPQSQLDQLSEASTGGFLVNQSEKGQPVDAYDATQQQPTIQHESQQPPASPTTTSELADRQITGLPHAPDADNSEADYIIEQDNDESKLGSGATGIVFKAKQISLDRTVAIKLLKKQISTLEDGSLKSTAAPRQKDVDKFLYESQITAGLDHPNVITVHDLGVTKDQMLFYSMKMFDGGADWGREFETNTLEQNLHIFNDVCNAMRRAHSDRIIHRDLKPQNVMVGEFGEVQVSDWGLAIDLKLGPSKSFPGGGTPCYMAPEMSKHYLVQQDLKDLNAQLNMAVANTPWDINTSESIEKKIAELESEEKQLRQQITELSDVYVLGAILFHLAAGYPPHLFQLGDIHREQWGSDASKEKMNREIKMSAEGVIADYEVKDVSKPEAREALKGIALKALAHDPSQRLPDVATLQQAVREFRGFMRCVEATYLGNEEVELSRKAGKSYVNLNSAIYAYQGALEKYPEYEPANLGLARAKFLYAERALKNQDFELGLATMTEDAIERQTDKELATELRNELVTQRNRRDQRKRLLYIASMASLVSIAIGSLFAVLAVYASNSAAKSRQAAEDSRQVAIEQTQKAEDARLDELEAKKNLIASLTKFKDLQLDADGLEVIVKTQTPTLAAIKQRAKVAEAEADLAILNADFTELETALQKKDAGIRVEIAGKNASLATLEAYKAQIEAERIKENTQFEQYANRLKSIESNIGTEISNSEIEKVFLSPDISLGIKNAWELHHLYKQANPAASNRTVAANHQFKMLELDAEGKSGVAVSKQNTIYRVVAGRETEQLDVPELTDAEILSVDVSADGRWLVIAQQKSIADASDPAASLPVMYDLEKNKRLPIAPAIAKQLQFRAASVDRATSVEPDRTGNLEKYFCQPQHVEFLPGRNAAPRLFMVDRRVQRGLNQLRCSVSDLEFDGSKFSGNVTKTKVAGQAFLKNPGLLTGAQCLATAIELADGRFVAAIANSQPDFGVIVIALDRAVELLNSPRRSISAKAEQRFFRTMRRQSIRLGDLRPEFAPTAIKILPSGESGIQLLVGNGKGELAGIDYQLSSKESFVYRANASYMLSMEGAANKSFKLVKSNTVTDRTAAITRLDVKRAASAFSSSHFDAEKLQRSLPAHRSAVRAIRNVNNVVYSASETELIGWVWKNGRLVADTQLFGQPGKLAALAIGTNRGQTEATTVANDGRGESTFVKWTPDSNKHKATIEFKNFRTDSGSYKKLIAGVPDSKPGSEAVVLAFSDGTLRYADPVRGTIEIERPTEAGVDPSQSTTLNDFRNGQFAYFKDSQRVIMFSNTFGIKTWRLGDSKNSDPIRSNSKLYSGKSSNSAVFFSADEAGRNIVTSHPNKRDRFLLWQLKDDGSYAANVIGPFESGTNSREIDVVVQPEISPDGSLIACALRTRNAYSVNLLRTSPSRAPEKVGFFESDRRTNFRSMHFVSNDRVLISQEQSARPERITSLVQLANNDNAWAPTTVQLPQNVSSQFKQVAVSDIAVINGRPFFVGFGIPAGQKNDGPASGLLSGRKLIAWNDQQVVYQKALAFNRRISPHFDQNQLKYLVAGQANSPGQLVSVDFDNEYKEVSMSVECHLGPVRKWSLAGQGNGLFGGDDWFCVAATDGRNKLEPLFSHSLPNPPRRLNLSGDNLLVHHQDLTASHITIQAGKPSESKVKRLAGFYNFVDQSADGTEIAVISKDDNSVSVIDTANPDQKSKLNTTGIATAWIRSNILRKFGAKTTDNQNVLAVLSRGDKELKLSFYDASGKPIDAANTAAVLPVSKDRGLNNVKSFTISNVTGEFVAVVWDTDENDRANVWKFAAASETPDIKRWFPIDLSDVGRVESIDFGEVLDSRVSESNVATRLAISANNQGSKSIRLYALELALKLRTRPLLELYTADRLQPVDQIIGAQFSGDGKTLLSMTSERANVRLTAGWDLARKDVDIEQQIRLFQSKQESIDSNLLKSEVVALEKSRTEVFETEDLNELETSISSGEKTLQTELADLAERNDRLNEEVQKITEELKTKSENVQTTIADEIRRLTDQVQALNSAGKLDTSED